MAADTVGAYALSEAGSGSDAFALQTRAELKGSDYVLNGRKLWITNAKEAGIFVLFATVDPSAGYKGITAFVIEKEFSGFTVGKKESPQKRLGFGEGLFHESFVHRKVARLPEVMS